MAASAPIAVQHAARVRAVIAACRANGLDDDARYLLMENLVAKKSLKDCSISELATLLDHLNRGKNGYAGRDRVTPAADRAPLLGKVDALLAELHRVTGNVYRLAYADGVARRVCKRSSLDFCDPADLQKVIAALATTLRHETAKRVA